MTMSLGVPHNPAMRYSDLVDFYGSAAAAARAIGVQPPSVAEWKLNGIPALRQLHIEKLTKGRLKADAVTPKGRAA